LGAALKDRGISFAGNCNIRTWKGYGPVKRKIIFAAVLVTAACVFFGTGFYAGSAATSGAGSQNDPVVSLSYLEYRLEQLEGGSGGKGGNLSGGAVRLELKEGERYFPGEGSLAVVYSGSCAITGGTAADLTAGKQIGAGEKLPLYSQILIPEDDCGLAASDNSVLFVWVNP